MEKVIYSRQGGLGIIMEQGENEMDYIIGKSFVINGEDLKTGESTDLFGLFSEPVKYVGVLKSDINCMCFWLGSNSDIFDTKTYYSCFYYISENRLANKYKEGTVRDLTFTNGKWK